MSDTGSWTSPGGGDWQPPTYSAEHPAPVAPEATATPAAGGWQGWAPAWVPMPGVVPLRPLGVGELLDGGVKVIRRYPKPTLALSAVVSVVVALIDIAFLLSFGDSRTVDLNDGTGSGVGQSYDATSLPGIVLGFLGGILLTGALVSVVSRAVLGQQATLADAWAATRPRLWALLGVALLRGLLMLAPLLVVGVAALVVGPLALLLLLVLLPLEVYLWTVTAVAPAALVLEKAGVVASLKRARVLSGRSFWRTLGLLSLCWLITTVIASILVVPVVIVADLPLLRDGSTTLGTGFLVTSAVASALAQTLVAPYTAGFRALVYVDQRMRSEGLDVALQAAAATPAA